jgi:hypothetical protein
MAARAARCGLGLSRIGRVVAGAGLQVFDDEAAGAWAASAWPAEALPGGFDHFLSQDQAGAGA